MTLKPYLEPRQTLLREPTEYEDLFATSLESAFANGASSLEELVASLNRSGPRPQHAIEWTVALLDAELARFAEI